MRGVRGERKQPGEFRISQNWIGGSSLQGAAFVPPQQDGVPELICGVLNKPSLYLSDFFERNRASYYHALMAVRVRNDMVHWLRFFLQGVAQTAQKGRDVFRPVLQRRTEAEQAVLSLGRRAPSARAALNVPYRNPMVSAVDLSRALSIGTPTSNALIRDWVQLGMLEENTGRQKGRIYVFGRYLKLFVS